MINVTYHPSIKAIFTAPQRTDKATRSIMSLVKILPSASAAAIILCVVCIAHGCRQAVTNRPVSGQWCVKEDATNISDVTHQACVGRCIRETKCRAVSYNMVGNYCILVAEPCAVTSPHNDFL